MKKSILLLIAAFATLVTNAQTKVEIDGIWYNLVSKTKQAEVTSSDDTYYSGSFTIPTTITHEGVNYSVTRIGDIAFYCCSTLTAINIPESVTSIGSYAFAYCPCLTYINIPEGVTSIESGTFEGSNHLTAITLPEDMTSIRENAFAYCSSLTAINIPKGVTSIESDAFRACSSLLDIYCYAEDIPSTESNAFQGSNTSNATLHVPSSALNAYKSAAPWSSFGTIVALTEEENGIENEEFTIQNSPIIYDLHGRRVTNPIKGGIYIVGGKKMMVK